MIKDLIFRLAIVVLLVFAASSSMAVPGTEVYSITATYSTSDGSLVYLLDYDDAGPDGLWDCGGDDNNTMLTNVSVNASGHIAVSNVLVVTVEDHSNGNISNITREYGKVTYGIPDVSYVPVLGVENAFAGCSGIQSVSIASGMTVSDSFTGCSALQAVVFADESTYLAKRDALEQARVGSGEYWEDSATGIRWFYTATNGGVRVDAAVGGSGAVTIPETINGVNVTAIGSRAFCGLGSIISICVPSNVTSVSDGAFSNCVALAEVAFRGNPPACGAMAFAEATSIIHPNTAAWTSAFSGGTWNGCRGWSGETFEARSTAIGIFLNHDGVRSSTGSETLRYSSLWDGGTNSTAKVAIKQGDTTLVEDLTGEGDHEWNVSMDGTYVLAHTTYTNGHVAAVQSTTFVVTGLNADIDASAVDPVCADPADPNAPYSTYDTTAFYDGLGHTINTQALYAVTIEGAAPNFSFSLTSNGVYQSSPFVYTNVGDYVVWYRIEAPGYNSFTHSARVSIALKPIVIDSVVASQRYPWNGLVDVDVVLSGGDPDLAYMVSLVAKDLDAGTNVAMNTFATGSAGVVVSGSGVVLLPGTHRLIWDADTDITSDFNCTNMSISAEASGPVLIAPQNVRQNTRWVETVDFIWDPVPSAVSYEFYESTEPDLSKAVWIYETSDTKCSDYYYDFEDTNKIPSGHQRYLWLRAKDKNGNVGPFSGPYYTGGYPS